MSGMDMAGASTMTMAWMRMPGQSWPGAASAFLGMWTVMMVAMMMPSLVPTLWRFRGVVEAAGRARPGAMTALAGAGYFFAWTMLGAGLYPLGVATAEITMRHTALAPVMPLAAGFVMLLAGVLQFTTWKARQLACCRQGPGARETVPTGAGPALRYGLRLGGHCISCCAGPTAVLLVMGVMDTAVMAVVAAAITVERLAPAGAAAARAIGVVAIAGGLLAIAWAAAAL